MILRGVDHIVFREADGGVVVANRIYGKTKIIAMLSLS